MPGGKYQEVGNDQQIPALHIQNEQVVFFATTAKRLIIVLSKEKLFLDGNFMSVLGSIILDTRIFKGCIN